MADSVFFFLPIMIGFNTAKRLDSNPILTAVIAGVLVHPSILEAANSGRNILRMGSLNFPFVSYTYSIFPMILAAGGFLTGILKINMWNIIGSLIGLSSFIDPVNGITSNFWYAVLVTLVTIFLAFILTYIWGYNDDMEMQEERKPAENPAKRYIQYKNKNKSFLSLYWTPYSYNSCKRLVM